MNSISILLNEIRVRPAMYISKRSISCLKAFLDGWYLRDPQSVDDADVMDNFQDWIEKKYNIKTSHSWSAIILFYSQDEYDALEVFFKEFDIFLEERNYIASTDNSRKV